MTKLEMQERIADLEEIVAGLVEFAAGQIAVNRSQGMLNEAIAELHHGPSPLLPMSSGEMKH
jgi:hypothetical protein